MILSPPHGHYAMLVLLPLVILFGHDSVSRGTPSAVAFIGVGGFLIATLLYRWRYSSVREVTLEPSESCSGLYFREADVCVESIHVDWYDHPDSDNFRPIWLTVDLVISTGGRIRVARQPAARWAARLREMEESGVTVSHSSEEGPRSILELAMKRYRTGSRNWRVP